MNRRNLLQLGLVSSIIPAIQNILYGKYFIDEQSFYEYELSKTGKLVGETFTVNREFKIPYKKFEIIDCNIILDTPMNLDCMLSYNNSTYSVASIFNFEKGIHEGAILQNLYISCKNTKCTISIGSCHILV